RTPPAIIRLGLGGAQAARSGQGCRLGEHSRSRTQDYARYRERRSHFGYPSCAISHQRAARGPFSRSERRRAQTNSEKSLCRDEEAALSNAAATPGYAVALER